MFRSERRQTILLLAIFLALGILSLWLANPSWRTASSRILGVNSEYPRLTDSLVLAKVEIKSEQKVESNLNSGAARIQHQINSIDWRAYVLDKFFASKGSPLAGQGVNFVKYCDLYGAPRDCTAIPGISFAETNYCKYPASQEIFNCWGFGGSPGNRIKFGSYEEAIKFVTERLVRSYGNDFLTKPRIASTVYCGKPCPTWGIAVENARAEINRLSVSLGFGNMR